MARSVLQAPEIVLPHKLPEGYVQQVLNEAKRLHERGFWIIPIRTRGERYKRRAGEKWIEAVAKGKEPFGMSWGAKRWPWGDVEKEIRKVPGRGYGIVLGPGRALGGGWLIDGEGDGPEAESSWLTLCCGENIATMALGSRRGRHRFLIVDGPRLLDLLVKSGGSVKTNTNGKKEPGVYHHPQLPGLELRTSGFNSKNEIKQVQSVGAPCLGEDGTATVSGCRATTWLSCRSPLTSGWRDLPGIATGQKP